MLEDPERLAADARRGITYVAPDRIERLCEQYVRLRMAMQNWLAAGTGCLAPMCNFAGRPCGRCLERLAEARLAARKALGDER